MGVIIVIIILVLLMNLVIKITKKVYTLMSRYKGQLHNNNHKPGENCPSNIDDAVWETFFSVVTILEIEEKIPLCIIGGRVCGNHNVIVKY